MWREGTAGLKQQEIKSADTALPCSAASSERMRQRVASRKGRGMVLELAEEGREKGSFMRVLYGS